MRLLFVLLVALVGLIQYPLWFGKGGWYRVWELQGQLAEQREINEGLRARNAALAAEVQDLQTGTGALEERARGDLGMMREGEIFVHILPANAQPPANAHNPVPVGTAPASGGAAHSGSQTAPHQAGHTASQATGGTAPNAGRHAAPNAASPTAASPNAAAPAASASSGSRTPSASPSRSQSGTSTPR